MCPRGRFAITHVAQTVGRLFGAPSRRVDSRSHRWPKQSAISSVRPVGGSIRDHTCGSNSRPSLRCAQSASQLAITYVARTVSRLFGAPSRRVDSRSHMWLEQSAFSSVRPVGGSIRDHTCGSNSRPSLWRGQSAGQFAITHARPFGAPHRPVKNRDHLAADNCASLRVHSDPQSSRNYTPKSEVECESFKRSVIALRQVSDGDVSSVHTLQCDWVQALHYMPIGKGTRPPFSWDAMGRMSYGRSFFLLGLFFQFV